MFNKTTTHNHSRVKGKKMELLAQSLSQFYEKDVVCLTINDTIFDAAKLMLEKHIGDIVITDENADRSPIPVGIITDRDIVVNSVAKKLDPASVKLSAVMTEQLVTATEESSLTDLVQLMTDEGISRLPIVDSGGALVGILSSKRIFQYFAQGLCELSSLTVRQQQREQDTH
ncbi:MAG: CBS domain-containing protein [Bdellovibrionota bacterium]